MKIAAAVSAGILPAMIFFLIGYGLRHAVPVYDSFAAGASKGLKTVAEICPTLIGLMVGVGVLRASGFLDALTAVLALAAQRLCFPGELVPVTVVRLFSSSAATGLILDIFQKYGPDSRLGFLASVSNACTETVFYTMSVYFLAARVSKTRWTLAGALLAGLTGIAASTVLTEWMFRG